VTVGFDRGANLLGSLSLALSDRMSDAISAAAAQSDRPGSETAAEALSALHHFLDGPSIDRLRTVLGSPRPAPCAWSIGWSRRGTSRARAVRMAARRSCG
jgi:hypothetical protein